MFESKMHESRDMANFQAYMTGYYVQMAIASCLSKDAKYPSEPIDVRSAAEIERFRASPEYQEQQRLIMLTKMRQDERRERRDKKRKTEMQSKGGWIDG